MSPANIDEIVFIDFEFQALPGERPKPVCLVAREHKSGRLFRIWLDGVDWPRSPPFATGPRVIIVAYFASAELTCFLVLGWSLPDWLIDLFVEFRVLTNGLWLEKGRGLLGAMHYFGLGGIEVGEKDVWRKRIIQGPPFNPPEQEAILTYCQSDVDALVQLYPYIMGNVTDLITTLWRAEYMKVVAKAEHAGVPFDADLYRRMRDRWPEIKSHAIARVNEEIPVYEKGHFRAGLFEQYLREKQWLAEWPRTATGELATDDDTFHDAAQVHPELLPLQQTRQLLGQLRETGLTVGADNRNRCMLSSYGTITGRNTPSTAKFVFAAPSFMRGLVRPEPGKALAYIDWRAQEFGIAAALSGDPAMLEAYRSGDCYLAFAKLARAVPENATKESHPHERSLYKTTILGTQYLIGSNGLGVRLGVTLNESDDLLDHHHLIFRRYWEWSDAVSDYGQMRGELVAAFGWRLQFGPSVSLRSLRNFPMQANGSEMLRLAAVLTMRAGVSIVALVHDAIMIEADEPEIEHAVALTEASMRRASELVLTGVALETEVRVLRFPERMIEPRGQAMWDRMMEILVA